jgi:hypothetical protein
VADTDTPFADWHVTVRLTAVRGRLHDFVVEVCDDGGPIARAEHTRARGGRAQAAGDGAAPGRPPGHVAAGLIQPVAST